MLYVNIYVINADDIEVRGALRVLSYNMPCQNNSETNSKWHLKIILGFNTNTYLHINISRY